MKDKIIDVLRLAIGLPIMIIVIAFSYIIKGGMR